MAKITKEQGISISLATIATWVPLIPLLWFVAQPILVSAVSEAMAEDIQQQVQQGVAPLNMAFVAIIQSNIERLRRQIADMEFRRDNPPPDDWTSEDAQQLVNLNIELDTQEDALEALMNTPTG